MSAETNIPLPTPENSAENEALEIASHLYAHEEATSNASVPGVIATGTTLSSEKKEVQSRLVRVREWSAPYLENAKNNLKAVGEIAVSASSIAYVGIQRAAKERNEVARASKQLAKEQRDTQKAAEKEHNDRFSKSLGHEVLAELGLSNPIIAVEKVEPITRRQKRQQKKAEKAIVKHREATAKGLRQSFMYQTGDRTYKIRTKYTRLKHAVSRNKRNGVTLPKLHKGGDATRTELYTIKLLRNAAQSGAWADTVPSFTPNLARNTEPPLPLHITPENSKTEDELLVDDRLAFERFKQLSSPEAIKLLRWRINEGVGHEVSNLTQLNKQRHLGLTGKSIENLARMRITKSVLDAHFEIPEDGDLFDDVPMYVQDRTFELLTISDKELDEIIATQRDNASRGVDMSRVSPETRKKLEERLSALKQNAESAKPSLTVLDGGRSQVDS